MASSGSNKDCVNIDDVQAIYFRDQLREARVKAFQDSESFSEILFVIERLGSYLIGKIGALGDYRSCIQTLAKNSSLSKEIPKKYPNSHIRFHRLYQLVMQARNDALHQGAYARHLTTRSIELSLVLEDALMSDAKLVRDYMVANPVCASLWQPLSFIRQQMLANSFSFLPVYSSGSWQFISDQTLAQYLRGRKKERDERMAQSLEEALKSKPSLLVLANTVKPDDDIHEAMKHINNNCPVLVISKIKDELGSEREEAVGILTSFDLL